MKEKKVKWIADDCIREASPHSFSQARCHDPIIPPTFVVAVRRSSLEKIRSALRYVDKMVREDKQFMYL
jgi:hypothetical protein